MENRRMYFVEKGWDMFFKKIWKKILVALFASLWAGCESESETGTLYGCGPCGCDDDCVEDSTFVEQPEINEIDAPIAVYGPPCYFDGTCGDDEPSVELDEMK